MKEAKWITETERVKYLNKARNYWKYGDIKNEQMR